MAKVTTDLRLDSVRIRWESDECVVGEAYGCVAEAEVSYAIGNNGDRRLERLKSGGLWNVDAQPGDPYRREVEHAELVDLREHLTHFGVEVSDEEWYAVVRFAIRTGRSDGTVHGPAA